MFTEAIPLRRANSMPAIFTHYPKRYERNTLKDTSAHYQADAFDSTRPAPSQTFWSKARHAFDKATASPYVRIPALTLGLLTSLGAIAVLTLGLFVLLNPSIVGVIIGGAVLTPIVFTWCCIGVGSGLSSLSSLLLSIAKNGSAYKKDQAAAAGAQKQPTASPLPSQR